MRTKPAEQAQEDPACCAAQSGARQVIPQSLQAPVHDRLEEDSALPTTSPVHLGLSTGHGQRVSALRGSSGRGSTPGRANDVRC